MIYKSREDSDLLSNTIKKYVRNKTFLDLGSGSGIQAETALKAKARSVTSTDIQPEVIKHLKSKFKNRIKIIQSDLFKRIRGRFDIIAFNPPYLPLDDLEDSESQVTTTGGKRGDEIVLGFLKQIKGHLNKGGKIFLLLSSLTPKDKIKPLLEKLKMKYKVLASKNLFQEKLEVWEITRQSI